MRWEWDSWANTSLAGEFQHQSRQGSRPTPSMRCCASATFAVLARCLPCTPRPVDASAPGIASLIAHYAHARHGVPEKEARRTCYFVDTHGLVR